MIFVTFMLVMFVILSTTFNTMLLFAWVHLTLRPSFQGRILPGPLPGPLLGPLWSPRGHHLGPWSRPGQTLLCALLRNLLQQQAANLVAICKPLRESCHSHFNYIWPRGKKCTTRQKHTQKTNNNRIIMILLSDLFPSETSHQRPQV